MNEEMYREVVPPAWVAGSVLRALRGEYEYGLAARGAVTREEMQSSASHPEALGSGTGSAAQSSSAPLGADAMVDRLRRAGYRTDAATYVKWEAGTLLPAAPSAFLDAVSEALALGLTAQLRLVHALAFDIVRHELGLDAAIMFFSAIGHPPARA